MYVYVCTSYVYKPNSKKQANILDGVVVWYNYKAKVNAHM